MNKQDSISSSYSTDELVHKIKKKYGISDKWIDRAMIELKQEATAQVIKDVLEKIQFCADWITVEDGKEAQENNLNVQVKLNNLIEWLEQYQKDNSGDEGKRLVRVRPNPYKDKEVKA